MGLIIPVQVVAVSAEMICRVLAGICKYLQAAKDKLSLTLLLHHITNPEIALAEKDIFGTHTTESGERHTIFSKSNNLDMGNTEVP